MVRGGTYIMAVLTRGPMCAPHESTLTLIFTDSKERRMAKDGTYTMVVVIRGLVCACTTCVNLTEFVCH